MSTEERPLLSVVIPSWNTRDLLKKCLETLFVARVPGEMEVLLVENGSEDDSAEMVRRHFPQVRLIINRKNEGFAKGSNQGLREARGRFVLLLNTDTEIREDALERLLEFLEQHPEHGSVAPRLIHPDGRTQRTVMAFPGIWTPLFFATPLERWLPNSSELRRYFLKDWDQETSRDIDQPPAACLLLRREVLEQVGYFDEDLWLFYNDVDLSKRMKRAGWKTHYLAEAQVVHHVGASTSKFGRFVPIWQMNRLTYYKKHHGVVGGLWVKACVGFAFCDFAVTQWWGRLRGKGGEPVGPTAREFWGFLRG